MHVRSSLAGDDLLEHVRALEANQRQMEALLELGQRFMVERDPVALLPEVCEAARTMTQAAFAGVGILGAKGDAYAHLITAGFDALTADAMQRGLAMGPGMQRVLLSRLSVRGGGPGAAALPIVMPAWHPTVDSYLLVPVASPARVYGWFGLLQKRGAAQFTDTDERVARTIGVQVGIAYENASLMHRLIDQAKALRDHEDDMEFAMSVARVGVSVRELDSNVLMLSRSLADLLELPPGARSITREDFLARVHPEDIAQIQSAVAEATLNGAEFELEYRVHTPTHGWRWIRSNGRVTANRNGQNPRLFSGIVDVTERRTLELQLHQARKMEAIGQLAGGIAHDFNNLLTAIMGYAEFLQGTVTLPRQRRDVGEIVKATARAASLTKRLLAFSRRQVIEAVLVDVNLMVEDVTEMLRRLIGEHIELTTDLAVGLPAVHADRSQLEQLLMNLVVNARDATEGEGTISVRTSRADLEDGPPSYGLSVKRGSYVVLTVADTGTGMTEDTKRRLFEPFFTTKARERGTGLGLATVYGIVAQTGGSILVESDLGRGSTFTVFLPAQDQPAPLSAGARPTRVAGGTETVLLAEDEPAVRSLARVILERAGYKVIDAASPAEAEAKAAEVDTIDLLLTDVVMPGGTGPSLFRRLAPLRPSMRVLFMSGYADRRLFDGAAIDGTDAFMEKPFSAEMLLARIRKILDR
jgi:signal transduction histidine kinase/CheY-like chemotaxis protein